MLKLGATPTRDGVEFALRSRHATGVDLCLFDPDAPVENRRLPLERVGHDVWRGVVPGIGRGQLYGYRVHGAYAPADGHRFNPNKLLLDPYARLLSGEIVWDDATYGYDPRSPELDLSFDGRDSAPYMPRCVVVEDAYDWAGDAPLRRPMAETVIYEAHVKGLTALHPDIPPELRGTVEALGHPAVTAHLLGLGVTALELLPIQAFSNDRFLAERGLSNYWGYSTLGFFAPHARYLGPAGTAGLKGAIAALHRAGIEVILDVVYNHTAELEETGPTLSFRGIDNALYYKPREGDPGDPRRTFNPTGCGNALDLSEPAVASTVLDSLRYWVEDFHIDGFRFDLAATLARNPIAFDPDCPFLRQLAADPVLSGVKLIAEPWDIGPDGYRLGGFPPGWSEWNDRFRDAARRFWRGERGQVPELVRGLAGSSDVFAPSGRGPTASVNYVASHDGFTLADVAMYERKHNERNGENNRDGHDDNHSCNFGIEGPTDDPAVRAARARHVRNLLATLFVSLGTPMLLGGDELGRSQGGNNNAYCQDNPTGWLDWDVTARPDPDLAAFIAALTRLRRDHPVLRRAGFLTGRPDPTTGLKDVTWLACDGHEIAGANWDDEGREALGIALADADPGQARLLILMSASPHPIPFALPSEYGPHGWVLLLDTGVPAGRPADIGHERRHSGTFNLEARSVVLFRSAFPSGSS